MQPVCLNDFFNAPVVNRNWRINRSNEDLIRFGLLCKVYDMVGFMGLSYSCPILCDTSQSERSGWWLLGGVLGTSFLVQQCGLIQPRAGGGIIAPGYQRGNRPGQDPTTARNSFLFVSKAARTSISLLNSRGLLLT